MKWEIKYEDSHVEIVEADNVYYLLMFPEFTGDVNDIKSITKLDEKE